MVSNNVREGVPVVGGLGICEEVGRWRVDSPMENSAGGGLLVRFFSSLVN